MNSNKTSCKMRTMALPFIGLAFLAAALVLLLPERAESKEKDWAFNHMGVSFKDVKKTIDYFESTGIGVRMP